MGAIEKGIAGAIGFLNEEHIFDRDRLPTVAVVPVLASIWSQMPQSLDAHGQARTLLRQYLWRSFSPNGTNAQQALRRYKTIEVW